MLNDDKLPPVLLVYLRKSRKGLPWGGALRSPRFEKIAERTFIVGETISKTNHPYAGRQTGFAWEEVSTVIEFESEEAYLAGKRRRRSFFR